MSPGRIPETNLADDVAQGIYEQNIGMVSASTSLDGIVKYPNLNFKHRGKWSELYVHRGLLLELFRSSSGLLLRQKGQNISTHSSLAAN